MHEIAAGDSTVSLTIYWMVRYTKDLSSVTHMLLVVDGAVAGACKKLKVL